MTSPNIHKNLPDRKDESIRKFNKSADRLILKRSILIWNKVLYKAFNAWVEINKEECKGRLLDMRMQYWRAHRALISWNTRVNRSKKLNCILRFINEKHIFYKKTIGLKRWMLATKIQTACYKQSDKFKAKALAITMLRIIWFHLMKKRMFKLWMNEVETQRKMEWALEMNFGRIRRKYFSRWNCFYHNIIFQRNAAEHKRWATNTIRSLMETNIDNTQTAGDMPSVIDNSEQKIGIIRKKYVADFDRQVMEKQRNVRRQRYEEERKRLLSNFHDHWRRIEDDRVDKVANNSKRWLLETNEGQEQVVKFVKRFKEQLKTPSIESSNIVLITLSVLDGNLASIGMLQDEFFEKIAGMTKFNGLIDFDGFISYLGEIGIEMNASQVRDLFNGLERKNTRKRGVPISLLQHLMTSTYRCIGSEGTRYKQYISPCHGMMVIHDVLNNEVSFFQRTIVLI